MRILLDQGLPRSVAGLLSAAGFDTAHTADVGMAEAKDDEILAYARSTDRIVVTQDADFHMLLALAGAAGPSVIRIRMDRARAAEVAALVLAIVGACRPALESGAVVTARSGRVRVRRLPIAR